MGTITEVDCCSNPPHPDGNLMVFLMSQKAGGYNQTMGDIAPICLAIGENDLNPFWESIKSAPWHNLGQIKKRRCRCCVSVWSIAIAATTTVLIGRFNEFLVGGVMLACLFAVMAILYWEISYYQKNIAKREDYITLKANDQNRKFLEDKNLILDVGFRAEWITLRYIGAFHENKTKPRNENYGNQNNNPYGPPQPPFEEPVFYQNNLPPKRNQIDLSDDPVPMNNNGWGMNPIKEG